MEIDTKIIKELIALMEEHNLSEIEIEKEGIKVKLKKGGQEIKVVESVPLGGVSFQKEKTSEVGEEKNAIQVTSPMVGTFYRAPSPGAQPYVEVGQIVNPGDVLCIIEAMKLMNEIKSEVKGKILEILVDNGQPVEFGQPLFLVEPIS